MAEKGAESSPNVAMLPAAFMAIAADMGDHKIKIVTKGSCPGGQIGKRWLAGVEK